MKEYLTIKEFSKRVNTTPQSIYKKLNKKDNPLNNYVKVVNGKKMLSVKALKLYQNPEEEEKAEVEAGSQDINLKIIELLQKELEEKNKQIENLNKLLDQQQQLQLQVMTELKQAREEKILLESKVVQEENKKWWKIF